MSVAVLRLIKFVIGLQFIFAAAVPASAQEFYKGKTVVVIVGTAAGGGFDTYSRMLARHIGKYLPGNPSVIVQNMPGAGQLIAANHLFNRVQPDGLTIGHFSGSVIFRHVMGDQSVLFDGRKFGWLGTPAPERHTCVVTEKSGVKTFEDWFTSKRTLKLGSLGPGNSTSAWPHLLRVVLGLPISVIEGFKGTSEIRLAAESGEVDGACWGWDSIKVTWAKGLETGFVRPVIQTMLEPHPDLPTIPVAIQHAKTKEGQDLLRLAAQAYGPASIAYSVPPGLAKERLLALQNGFMATMKDPEFSAEAKKANLVVSSIDGPTIGKTVAELYRTETKLLDRFREIIEVTPAQR
ncbi:MAG: Bug family tripartite tricarboxylate transporter substrate binding protein [bacterium]